jgi:hypothetical protein
MGNSSETEKHAHFLLLSIKRVFLFSTTIPAGFEGCNV